MQEEQVQALNDIGLSVLQARTYLCLAKLGEADVGRISKASNLVRQDIYRVMPSLEKLGLAEKILAKPTIYRATSIKEGVSILLQNRKRKDEEATKEACLLVQSFSERVPSSDVQEIDSQFRITSEESLLIKLHAQQIEKSQTAIDIVVPCQKLEELMLHSSCFLVRAMKRGVRIRLITQETKKPFMHGKLDQLVEESVMEIGYSTKINSSGLPWFGMHIFDDKEVTLCISRNGVVPSLWSNSPQFLKLAGTYFEDLWNTAVPLLPIKVR